MGYGISSQTLDPTWREGLPFALPRLTTGRFIANLISNNSVLFQQNACRRYMSICAPTSSPESGRILRFRPMMLDFAHHFLCDSLEK